jgi:hypothetical protein
VLEGELVGWVLRSAERVPGVFPLSPNWLFILFGLGTIGYARHPEGVIDQVRARTAARRAKRAARRAPAPPPPPARRQVEEPVG